MNILLSKFGPLGPYIIGVYGIGILSHFCPISVVNLSHFQMTVEAKDLYLDALLFRASHFTPLHSGVPEIPQVSTTENCLNFRKVLQIFFQARYLIGLPGDTLKFEKHGIITKKYLYLSSI